MKIVDGNITNHFRLSEIACKDAANTLMIDQNVIRQANMLEAFRVWYGRPMQPSSWYRTKAHNASVGGALSSLHLSGQATDIHWPLDYSKMDNPRKKTFETNVLEKWKELCKEFHVAGAVFFYSWGFHVDSRPKGDFITKDYRR